MLEPVLGGGPAGVVEKFRVEGLVAAGVVAACDVALLPKNPVMPGASVGVAGTAAAWEEAEGGCRLLSDAFWPKLKPLVLGAGAPPNRLLVVVLFAPPKLKPAPPPPPPPPDAEAPPKSGLFSVPVDAVLPNRLGAGAEGVLPVLWPKRLGVGLELLDDEAAAPKMEGDEVPVEEAGPPKVNLGGSGMTCPCRVLCALRWSYNAALCLRAASELHSSPIRGAPFVIVPVALAPVARARWKSRETGVANGYKMQ